MRCMKCRFVRVHVYVVCTRMRALWSMLHSACFVQTHKFEIQVADDRGKQFKGIIYTQYTRRKGRRRERMPSHTHATILTETKRTNKKTKNQKSYDIFIVIELCVCAIFECNRRSCVAVGNVQYEHLWYSHVLVPLLVCTFYAQRCRVRACVCVCLSCIYAVWVIKPIKNSI